jgi:hypothetical protein
MATVGYGDISAGTYPEQLFAVIVIISGGATCVQEN